MVTCPPAGWSSSMSFAETSARASCLAPVRRAIPLPSPGDARSLVRGAKTRTRPAQLSISRPRRPGHSAEALGVIDARASKATAHGEAAHHALSGCRSAEPPACHLGAQHHPRAQPPVKGRTARKLTEKPLHTNFFVRLIETKSFTYSYAQDTRGFSGINDFVSISSEKKSIFFIRPFSFSFHLYIGILASHPRYSSILSFP